MELHRKSISIKCTAIYVIVLVALLIVFHTTSEWFNWYSGSIKVKDNLLAKTKHHEDDSVINPHPFHYLLNPKTFCSRKDVFIITYIHSAAANNIKRMAIRHTWSSRQMVLNKTILVVFVLGKVDDVTMMTSIKKEFDLYGDIVQEDFVDTYRNLTYKAIAGLKWVSTFCAHAEYVLKTDDDVFVNTTYLVDYIQSSLDPSHSKTNLMLCRVVARVSVMRQKYLKWYVTEKEYPCKSYRDYCLGLAFLMSTDLTEKLYNISFSTPFFWIDDYYVTGWLIDKLHVKHKQFSQAYHYGSVKEPSQSYAFYNLQRTSQAFSLWNGMMAEENEKKGVHKPSDTTQKGETKQNLLVK